MRTATKARSERANRIQGCRGDGDCATCRYAPICDIAKKRRARLGAAGPKQVMRKR